MKITVCWRAWRSALYFLSLSLSAPACADFSAGEPGPKVDAAPPISPALDRSLFERGSSMPRDLGVRDPCDPNPCAAGERCLADEGDGGDAWRCVAIACEAISCAPNERCVVGEGGAPRCVPLSCAGDGDCAFSEFCDLEQGQCLRDLCEGGRARCEGEQLVTCAENGSREGMPVSCGPESRCEEGEEGAFCACGSDWDCPNEGGAAARCEQGRCVGVDVAERCLLPPVPFSESLPAPELVWGSAPGEQAAVGRPFPESTQVVLTPIVANLSDDNGDGLIDERDYPELIFMSFCNSDFRMNGALRVVAGGGPARGGDLLTVLGDRRWHLDEPLPQGYSCEEGDLDPTGALAVGDLDAEGEEGARGTRGPEIVAPHEQRGVVVYSATGERLFDTAALGVGPGRARNPAVAIANLDGVGPAEIIIGATVFMLRYDEAGRLQPGESFSGTLGSGRNGQGPVSCIADIDEDGRLEVIGGGSVYRLPRPPAGAQERGDCAEAGGAISPQNSEEEDWCAGRLSLVWDSAEVNPNIAGREGFCAVADILGADELQPPSPTNPLDGRPELILISSGRLQVFNGAEGTLRLNIPLRLGENGGAPNVGDFDGDGFPEVGSAFARGYAMIDLQPPSEACAPWTEAISDDEAGPARAPGDACEDDEGCAEGARCLEGRCQCLHNGWRRSTEDDSSRVTGSTLFDFNGDGAVEVVYNDECWFRIYDGRRGEVLFKEPSESRTRIENPIVADVDNDGNAEIIFSTSTESEFCSQRREPAGGGPGRLLDLYNAGVEVWGDPQDRWVPA
ncbi:MAG: VCBS repeat-containing protein, partial [Myxococcota bacterium]|nr:VCBS repeat-containing protein [Myxococcota bacterium]